MKALRLTNQPDDMSEKKILRLSGILLVAGISLISLALFTPDAAGPPVAGSFFKIATSSPWGRPFDLTAVWCSFKIILLSLGVFLVVDVLGTTLLVVKRKKLARMVYALHLAPCLGLLIGGYCLVKALL